jgi:hypothetical protein
MQLTFSRAALLKSLRLFIVLLVLFGGASVYLFWYGGGHGSKRAIGLILMPLCGLLSALIIAKTTWLIRSNSPAASIERDGLGMQSFFQRRIVPWGQVQGVRLAEVAAGTTSIPAVEIERRGRHPVRLAVSLLSNSPAEIERWIATARARLAGEPV